MGRYVNPETGTKEQWLRNNGVEITEAPKEIKADDDFYPVCLVNNGPFTAAAIAAHERDLKEFTREDDLRPKTWYAVKKSIPQRSGFIN